MYFSSRALVCLVRALGYSIRSPRVTGDYGRRGSFVDDGWRRQTGNGSGHGGGNGGAPIDVAADADEHQQHRRPVDSNVLKDLLRDVRSNMSSAQVKRQKAKARKWRAIAERHATDAQQQNQLVLSSTPPPPSSAVQPSLFPEKVTPGNVNEALELERQARLAAEERCRELEQQRIVEMRRRAFELAPPPVVTPKPGAVHFVILPSHIMLAVPELYDMHAVSAFADDLARRVTLPTDVRATPDLCPHARTSRPVNHSLPTCCLPRSCRLTSPLRSAAWHSITFTRSGSARRAPTACASCRSCRPAVLRKRRRED